MTGPTWWVVTDLDGTLMDHRYDWSPAAEVLTRLRQNGIPVIPCTSKTAEEVERFRAEAGLRDPYIVENGGAIHSETMHEPLGPSWAELKPQLQLLAADLGEPLRALDDLTAAEGDRLLGLSGDGLLQAQRRRCSVPFVPPPAKLRSRLQQLAAERDLSIVQGNRMAHLLGAGVSKGRALAVLKQRLGAEGVQVLGLGDSPNDLPLLEAADVAVVVPGLEGPHPALRDAVDSGRFQLAAHPHARGWAEAVQRIVF